MIKEHERKFEEILVEYPPVELCTYPEYRGKPYFSIKYEENGEHIIGFGTYKPEVLSRYLREYFITPAIIEENKAEKYKDCFQPKSNEKPCSSQKDQVEGDAKAFQEVATAFQLGLSFGFIDGLNANKTPESEVENGKNKMV